MSIDTVIAATALGAFLGTIAAILATGALFAMMQRGGRDGRWRD